MISDWYHVDDKAENRYYAEPVNYKLRRNKMSETGKAESNLCYFARWAARFTQEKLPQQKHCLSYLRLAYVAFDTKELFVLS